MFCVSKTRGVSSPFICYRLGKISKYIFTTGYANVTAYKKRACSPPIVAKSGERFDCSFPKKGGGAIEHSAEKQPDAHSRWPSRASVTSLRVVPGAGCRGGVSPCKKSTRYSYLSILGTERLYLTFSSVKFIENYWKDDKNQSIFSTEPQKKDCCLILQQSFVFLMVPKVGLEPTRSREHQILSLACLPFHHFGVCTNTIIHIFYLSSRIIKKK